MKARFSPAITRRQSPPAALRRLPACAAAACGLWLGASDRELGPHYWKGHGLVAIVVALPAGAHPQAVPYALELCGPHACGSVLDPGIVEAVPMRSGAVRPRMPPAAPAPYYELEVVVQGGGVSIVPGAFYVRAVDAVRVAGPLTPARWARLPAHAAAALRAATKGVAPYPLPRIDTVVVGDRRARDPASYLRLFAVRGSPAVDPAGPRPTVDAVHGFRAWRRWYAKVRRLWLPVVCSAPVASPWTGASTDVWISRRGALLERDGQVVRIDPALARRVRRGLPL
jgi:hypothetical protein